MTIDLHRRPLLALYPNISGLCYAVFEAELKAVDWGIKTARQAKHATLLRHASRLMEIFGPETIILPARKAVVRGSDRLRKIGYDIEQVAKVSGASVRAYTRSDIQSCFARHGAASKDAIARAIVRLLPEFEQHLPPPRKIWMSEDYRMGLFDAVALALTDNWAEGSGHTG